MLKKSLIWAAENDIKIDFQIIEDEIIMIVRKGEIYFAVRLIDKTNRMGSSTHNFVQEFLYPAIEAIKQEHNKNPEKNHV